ncbi:MAG: sulfatase [candidate division KSB1 bacterium]|nr:sulfatase [candidate division KSB1 bacterium]
MSVCTTRRKFIKNAALGCAVGLSGVSIHCKKSEKNKPNIFLFLSDDHGLFETGCYGNDTVQTPHIDQLASEGLRFTRMFTAEAMCSPARAMLYTGLFPHRNGLHQNHSKANADIKSLPHYLKTLGYRVILAGKIHVEPASVFPFEYIEKEETEEYISGNHDQPFCLIYATKNPHAPYFPEPPPEGGHHPEKIKIPPYLINAPHTREMVAAYYNKVKDMDKEVGQCRELLRKHNLEDRTVFIYASDNGPGLPFAKWTLYEAALNVPFVVKWPGVTRKNTVTDAMCQFTDVVPTFIEMAGGKVTGNLDGSSFLKVLKGNTKTHREYVYGTHTNEGIKQGSRYPIRSVRSSRYKYILNLNPNHTFTNNITEGHSPRPGLDADEAWYEWMRLAENDQEIADRMNHYQHRPPEELYDLENDPYEQSNIINDPERQHELKTLRKELRAWMLQQKDPLLVEWTNNS